MSASLAVQAMLRAALVSVPGVSVFDAVPAGAAAPYLTIGPDSVTDWSHKTGRGYEHRVLIGVWDDLPGRSRLKTMLGLVETAVLALSGNQGGWRIAHVLFVRSFVESDPEGWGHGVADFRIRSEEI